MSLSCPEREGGRMGGRGRERGGLEGEGERGGGRARDVFVLS